VRVRPPSRESEESARRPRSSPARHRRRLGGVLALLALAAAIVGLYAGSRQFYFLGTNDRGVLTLYRGVPYDLPLGIHLYTKNYASSVPARAVPPRQRDHVLKHKLRTKTDASGLMRQLERTYVRR
jgi:protein phosphatase